MSPAQLDRSETQTSLPARAWLTDRRYRAPALVFVISLLITAFVYRPGLGGSLHFDDPPSLAALSTVADARSALEYALTGYAGPTGRVLALASFAAQAYAWPSAPEVFLHTNICLHLLNGALVVLLLHLLCLARRENDEHAAWVPVLGGALWMLLPILASTSLFIVQRMTVLATTFALLGFIGYLYSRAGIARRPFRSLALMTVSLGLGTVLAVLAKENGALLPVLVLVTELTLLRAPLDGSRRTAWRIWFAAVLVAPAVLLLAYLSLHVRYSDDVVLMRGFDGPERLLTQASVLWEYLYRAVIPSVPALGPFHDDQVVHRDWLDPLSLLAVVAWLAAVAAAIGLRKRFPWLAFAVGWYLAGHALESTTIGLELYFEHRNYLPLIGPVFALVAAASSVAPQWQTLARTLLLAYTALLGALLFSTTSLWGTPPLAADMWARYRPDSLRATMYLSGYLQKDGFYHAARDLATEYAERHPQSGTARLLILDLSCGVEPDRAQPEQLDTLKRMLPTSTFEYAVFDMLQRFNQHARNGACDAVLTGETVYALASAAESNPAFRQHWLMRHNLNVLMAEDAYERRDLDLTMRHIETALAANFTVTTLTFAVRVLTSAGLQSEAVSFVRSARSHAPANSMQAVVWRQEIAALESAILTTEASPDHEPSRLERAAAGQTDTP